VFDQDADEEHRDEVIHQAREAVRTAQLLVQESNFEGVPRLVHNPNLKIPKPRPEIETRNPKPKPESPMPQTLNPQPLQEDVEEARRIVADAGAFPAPTTSPQPSTIKLSTLNQKSEP